MLAYGAQQAAQAIKITYRMKTKNCLFYRL